MVWGCGRKGWWQRACVICVARAEIRRDLPVCPQRQVASRRATASSTRGVSLTCRLANRFAFVNVIVHAIGVVPVPRAHTSTRHEYIVHSTCREISSGSGLLIDDKHTHTLPIRTYTVHHVAPHAITGRRQNRAAADYSVRCTKHSMCAIRDPERKGGGGGWRPTLV